MGDCKERKSVVQAVVMQNHRWKITSKKIGVGKQITVKASEKKKSK